MLLIVEGPDKAGKTTLVDTLASALRASPGTTFVDVLHRGPPTLHPLLEYELPLIGYRPGRGEHVVCDRWHLGEDVYPVVLGRDTWQDVAVRRHITLFLRSRGALVVHVDPPTEHLVRRFETLGDDVVTDVSTLLRARDEFRRAVSESPLHSVTVDGVGNLDVTVRSVLHLASLLDRDVTRLTPFETYVGPSRPDHLLLGDVRGVSGSDRSELPGPAFVPRRATSGHYLLSTLPADVMHGAGLANACDDDDVVALYETLGYPPVVALGRRASRRLGVLGVRHGAVPHPQFVRRFLHRHRDAYGGVITRALRTGEDLSTWRP